MGIRGLCASRVRAGLALASLRFGTRPCAKFIVSQPVGVFGRTPLRSQSTISIIIEIYIIVIRAYYALVHRGLYNLVSIMPFAIVDVHPSPTVTRPPRSTRGVLRVGKQSEWYPRPFFSFSFKR